MIIVKLLYSAIIAGILLACAFELIRVWTDSRVYVGQFDLVTVEGNAQPSDAFSRRIVAAQAIQAQQLLQYQRGAANGLGDATYIATGQPPIRLPQSVLSGVEIKVQSIDVGQILTQLRRGFSAPNEVRGHLTQRGQLFSGSVDWPRAPRGQGTGERLTQFYVPYSSEQQAADYIACSISWARAAANKPTIAEVPRAQFCNFVAALGDYYELSHRANIAALSAEDVNAVRRRAALLAAHFNDAEVYPELYRLRADFMDMLPSPTTEELIDVQENRVHYAMLSPDLATLPAETRRMRALALARPAIILDDTGVRSPPPNWQRLLQRQARATRAAASSTGLILMRNGAQQTPIGTGFVVAPGVIMTTTYVIDQGARRGTAEAPNREMSFCIGPDAEQCRATWTIGQTLYRGQPGQSYVALVELIGHDEGVAPALPLAAAPTDLNMLVGHFAFVVGYPYRDPRVPPEFVSSLLGESDGVRRLMPGRILAAGPTSQSSGAPAFTTDISTLGGTGGGPLVDLESGMVVGMSFAGLWQGERGKFAYATPIPDAARSVLAERLGQARTANPAVATP